MSGELILFLDFDGVLHPGEGTHALEQFSQLPILEQVLREHPHVNVVLSTSWREKMPLDDLREVFSLDLQPRVIGATPVINLPRSPSGLECMDRQAECLAWLRANRSPRHSWVAIDDRVTWFELDCHRLFVTDGSVGLAEDQLPALRAHIDRYTPHA